MVFRVLINISYWPSETFSDGIQVLPPTKDKHKSTSNFAVSCWVLVNLRLPEVAKNRRLVNGGDSMGTARIRSACPIRRFSWYMTKLLHTFPDGDEFEAKMQQAEFHQLKLTGHAAKLLAENYVGLPY